MPPNIMNYFIAEKQSKCKKRWPDTVILTARNRQCLPRYQVIWNITTSKYKMYQEMNTIFISLKLAPHTTSMRWASFISQYQNQYLNYPRAPSKLRVIEKIHSVWYEMYQARYWLQQFDILSSSHDTTCTLARIVWILMYSRAIWLCKLIFLLFWLAYSPKYPKTWGHNFPTPAPFSRGHILDDDVIQHNPNTKT